MPRFTLWTLASGAAATPRPEPRARVLLPPVSRHSAGQPIVAGWAYQLVAGLSFERDSWVAPTDARRVHPEEDANEVAVAQVKDLLRRAPGTCGAVPLFVFDAGYDPVKLQRGLEGHRAHILVRLHSNRAFYADQAEVEPRPVGRPRRHGSKFALPDPETFWPEPAREHRCLTGNYGEVRVRAWSGLHPKTRRIGEERYGCERAPVVRGTVVLWWRWARSCPARPASRRSCGSGSQAEATRTLTSCGGPTSGGSTSWSTRSASSSRDARMDHTEGQAPRAGGPLDVAPARRLRSIGAGALLRGRAPPAMGAPAARPAVDAVPEAPGFRGTLGGGGHPGEGAETLREVAG